MNPASKLILAAILAALCVPSLSRAQEAPPRTLFTNVNVFDGHSEQPAMGMNVLVENNLIKQVSPAAISAPSAAVSTAVEAGAKVIEPGQLVTEDTAKQMAKKGVWLSTQAWAAASPKAGKLMEAEGPLGVIEPGAYADIILVDGNPIEESEALTDTDRINLVMKDGRVYKNTL